MASGLHKGQHRWRWESCEHGRCGAGARVAGGWVEGLGRQERQRPRAWAVAGTGAAARAKRAGQSGRGGRIEDTAVCSMLRAARMSLVVSSSTGRVNFAIRAERSPGRTDFGTCPIFFSSSSPSASSSATLPPHSSSPKAAASALLFALEDLSRCLRASLRPGRGGAPAPG